MANITTQIDAIKARVDEISADATAEQLVYIGKALEAVAGQATVIDVSREGDAQTTRVSDEGDTQTTRITDEGDAQTTRVQSEGATQVQAVQDMANAGDRFAGVIDADVTLPVGFVAVYFVTADQAVTITLPDATTLAGPGVKVLTLISHTPFPATLVGADGTTLATVSGYKTATLDLLDTATVKGRWRIDLLRKWGIEQKPVVAPYNSNVRDYAFQTYNSNNSDYSEVHKGCSGWAV